MNCLDIQGSLTDSPNVSVPLFGRFSTWVRKIPEKANLKYEHLGNSTTAVARSLALHYHSLYYWGRYWVFRKGSDLAERRQYWDPAAVTHRRVGSPYSMPGIYLVYDNSVLTVVVRVP